VATENPPPQFDEQAALHALERLRDQIQDARIQRAQKLAEFDSFVRTNRARSQAERLAALDELEGSAPAVQTAARSADRGRETLLPQQVTDPPPPLPVVPPARLEPVHHSYMPDPAPDWFAVQPSIWQDRRYQIGAGIAAVLILLLLVVRPWRDTAPDAGETTAATASAPADRPAVPQGTSPAGPQSAPAAAPARAVRVELTTIRPVWMRVTVDGARQVERQVPGGQTLAFGADRAIVVRAGDAGAIRLTVGGADRGTLGRDGEVINRTFSAERR
jgi:Domain of unknown function (DUF4115)